MLLLNILLAIGLSVGPHWQQNDHPRWESSDISFNSNDQPRYYYSREAADYNEADNICQNNFGEGVGLAAIRNKDEEAALIAFLKRNMSPRTDVWIGGSYFQTDKKFVWTNLVGGDMRPLPLEDFLVKRIEGYPSTYNINDRTVFYLNDQFGDYKLKIETFTSTRKFVCEYRQNRTPPPCQVKSDIAVLLDSSGSISKPDYVLAKENAAKLIATHAASDDNRQLGAIFSHVTQIVVPLDSKAAPLEKFTMMNNAPYLGSTTNTGNAIKIATDELQRLKRDVPQSIVVITDGGSTDPTYLKQTVPAAKALRINMLAVGVGSNINRTELAFIADAGNVFYVNDWAQLQFKLNEIALSMCPKANRGSRRSY